MSIDLNNKRIGIKAFIKRQVTKKIDFEAE